MQTLIACFLTSSAAFSTTGVPFSIAYLYSSSALSLITSAFSRTISLAVSESKLANFILNNTPFLSGYATKSVEVYNDIYEVIDNRQGKTNYEVNKEALIILLDNKVITIDSVDILVRRNKIELEDTSFLDNYREGKV